VSFESSGASRWTGVRSADVQPLQPGVTLQHTSQPPWALSNRRFSLVLRSKKTPRSNRGTPLTPDSPGLCFCPVSSHSLAAALSPSLTGCSARRRSGVPLAIWLPFHSSFASFFWLRVSLFCHQPVTRLSPPLTSLLTENSRLPASPTWPPPRPSTNSTGLLFISYRFPTRTATSLDPQSTAPGSQDTRILYPGPFHIPLPLSKTRGVLGFD